MKLFAAIAVFSFVAIFSKAENTNSLSIRPEAGGPHEEWFWFSLSTNSFPLWPEAAPGSLGTSEKDMPTLTAFLPAPEKATGAAMVICPGGAYAGLAQHEGKGYAVWLNEHGISAFVLKYRLGTAGYRHPAMLQDASRAVRMVRARAEEWHLDRKRISIMGSSAG